MRWDQIIATTGRVNALAAMPSLGIANDTSMEEGSVSTAMLGGTVVGTLRVNGNSGNGAAVIIDGDNGRILVYDGTTYRVVLGFRPDPV